MILTSNLDNNVTVTSKKIDDYIISANYDIIIIFTIYIFITATFYLTKTEKRTKNSPTQLSYYSFEKRYYFCEKCLFSETTDTQFTYTYTQNSIF